MGWNGMKSAVVVFRIVWWWMEWVGRSVVDRSCSCVESKQSGSHQIDHTFLRLKLKTNPAMLVLVAFHAIRSKNLPPIAPAADMTSLFHTRSPKNHKPKDLDVASPALSLPQPNKHKKSTIASFGCDSFHSRNRKRHQESSQRDFCSQNELSFGEIEDKKL